MTKTERRKMWRIRKMIQRKYVITSETVCECGSNYKLERHHIDGNRKNNKLDNIKIICKKCHDKIHYIETLNKPLSENEIKNGLVFGITY